MLKPRKWMLVAALLLSAAPPLVAQEDEATGQEVDVEAEIASALEATTAWLEILDAGEYEETWNEAAAGFQAAVTVGDWIASVVQARSNFEPFGERTNLGSQYLTEIPNAPPGEYVVFQFRTVVAGDRTVVETVAPMKEDGAWKVSGYYVRPE